MSRPHLNTIRRPTAAPAELRGETSVKQPRWLTEAVATAVHVVRGQADAIAAALSVGANRVYEVADINAPVALKAFWIPAIVRETGSFAILDALEAQVGRVAIPIPSGTTCADRSDLVQFTAALMREVGEALERDRVLHRGRHHQPRRASAHPAADSRRARRAGVGRRARRAKGRRVSARRSIRPAEFRARARRQPHA
jgi:hypothetical protein